MVLIILYKRPIMSVKSTIGLSNDYSRCTNKIAKLKEMLELNLSAQQKLIMIKEANDVRKQELEEIGVLQPGFAHVNHLFLPDAPINQVKRVPALLQDQLLLKKHSTANEFQFLKNMTEEKLVKPKKHKTSRFEEFKIENLGPNPRAINFREIGAKLGKSGLEVYKEWREIFKVKGEKKLTSMDDARLKEKRKIYGDNWEKIGYFFNGLTFEKLYYYYHENLSGVQSGKWTSRQSLMLITLIDYYGVGKWALISKKLKVKSEFQVRERFCNVLDPTLKQNKWSDDDVRLLLEVASEENYKWSKIVKKVPRFANKTDNALRRKFRNIMIKKENSVIKQIVKNEKLVVSIIKFKEDYYNRSKNKNKAKLAIKLDDEELKIKKDQLDSKERDMLDEAEEEGEHDQQGEEGGGLKEFEEEILQEDD